MSKDQEYYANFGLQTVDEYVETLVFNSKTEMERFSSTIAFVPQDTISLLDVGCGPGVFLYLVNQELGIKGVGLEIIDAKIEYARRALNVDARHGQADQLPFPDRSFDTVTALEVIEHLTFGVYETALRELERVAKKWILVSVPYMEKRDFVKCPYCSAIFNTNYHHRVFNEDRMNQLFSDFRLVSMIQHGEYTQFYTPIGAIKKRFFSISFPQFAICPACGFKEVESKKSNKSEPIGGKGRKKKLMCWLYNCIPKKRRFRWMISLYQRI